MTIGDKIKALRAEKGMSIQELSKAAGLTTTTICGCENGKYKPTPKTIYKLAKAFDCSVDELYNLK